MIRSLTVNNHAKLGVLVKKWSKDPTSRPTTLDEFKIALTDAGISFDLANINVELQDPRKARHPGAAGPT